MPIHPIAVVDRVIEEYRDYLLTEFRAKDENLRDELRRALQAQGFLAQESFFQAYRPFKEGKAWRALGLDERLAKALETHSGSKTAFLHQSEAIAHLLGPNATPLAVTTGTSSGKSECFLVPVLQNAIEDTSRFSRNGLTAILVYPMNALATDQQKRIDKYLEESGHTSVRVERYDRTTSQAKREEMRRSPPHILLTNYMMLEYLLVRPADREALFRNHRCRFIVLDEVHTYRGSLGANIALLFRRLREHLRNAQQDWAAGNQDDARRFPKAIFVATSATIKSIDETRTRSEEERRSLREVAVQDFLKTITGFPPHVFKVLGEERQAPEVPPEAVWPAEPVVMDEPKHGDAEAVRRAVARLAGLPENTPVETAARSAKILYTLGDILSQRPLPVSGIVNAVLQNVPERRDKAPALVEKEVRTALFSGISLGELPGALRLRAHRFLRGGWRFHRCVDPACGTLHARGEMTCMACGKTAAPLLLCRACGMDALHFRADADPTKEKLEPYALDEDGEEWVLYDQRKLEINGAEDEGDGVEPPKPSGKKGKPTMKERPILRGSFEPVTSTFDENEAVFPVPVVLAPARSRCLSCGNDTRSGTMLTGVSLGTSAAVRVLAEGVVESLAEQHKLEPDGDGKERVLIFADSRQDAAHQAQFIEEAGRYDRMRRRLCRVLAEKGPSTIEDALGEMLRLAFEPKDNPHLKDGRERTLEVLGKTKREAALAWEEAPLLDDLAVRSHFRATVFHLGLVGVRYGELEKAIEDFGQKIKEILHLTSAQLSYLCRCLLDEMRQRGALSRPMLIFHPEMPNYKDAYRKADWERRFVHPQGYPCDASGNPRSYLESSDVVSGVRLNNAWRKPGRGGSVPRMQRMFTGLLRRMGNIEADERMFLETMHFLLEAGLVKAEKLYGYTGQTSTLLMVDASKIELMLLGGDERARCSKCNVRMPWVTEGSPCRLCAGVMRPWLKSDVETNRWFRRIRDAGEIALVAEEHTAQRPAETRTLIEHNFNASPKESPLNVLACSPTLEMGIDVRGLEAVIMRNVPPRPDNYAQRSGRAGRKSRAGVVLGYARNTPHDQYFYENPEEMIAGAIATPGVALANRDIVIRHLNAIALGSSTPGLAGRMCEYIDVGGNLKQEAIDALIQGFEAQFDMAAKLALAAWKDEVLGPLGLSTEEALRGVLGEQSDRIRNLFDRIRRQILELRKAVEQHAESLNNKQQANKAGDLIRRLLGLPLDDRQKDEADDRTSGHPMRRFAEFGILPGYEFPSQPATLRLHGDRQEEEPIGVERRFGIAQYQPNAIVHARGARWRVKGLDRASPWNPESDALAWRYVICETCGLRVDAQGAPSCPRCHSRKLTSKALPGYEMAGFLAVRDDSPVIDEEERISKAGAVRCEPQWDGEVFAAYILSNGWQIELRRNEEVRWINESRASRRESQDPFAVGPGFSLCPTCGNALELPEEETAKASGRKKELNRAPRKADAPDPYGHAMHCQRRGKRPEPFAITTGTQATTLRILVDLPMDFVPEDYMRFGVSLGYALRAGMRHLYMLDGPEIEFELEPSFPFQDEAGARRRGALTFLDPAVGGSGFLERAAAEMHMVADKAIEHLKHDDCETACYRCLKSYQNQRLHRLLSWPHALPALESIASKNPVRRLHGGSDTQRVKAWLEAYDAGVGSPLELRFLRLFEGKGINLEKQYAIEIEPGRGAMTFADFALPEKRLAIYIDGAGFHVGKNLRRDRYIREKLRTAVPPWRVEELTAADLRNGIAKLTDLFGEFPREAIQPTHDTTPKKAAEVSVIPEEERFFGDYELLMPLSHGGMAQVFKARNQQSGDIVFLKRVHIESADKESLDREEQIYHRLQFTTCQHVLQVLGAVKDCPPYYGLVTELADGGDLEAFVKRHPGGLLSPADALAVAKSVTAGIAELHSVNIVHRDIKPKNVLLSAGEWKITDFGISKNRMGSYTGGRTFQGAGTDGYAAPEQWRGVEAHPSADIYSLGKLFTFLLSGETLLDRVAKELVNWKELIRCMISEEVDQRPTIDEVMERLEALRPIS